MNSARPAEDPSDDESTAEQPTRRSYQKPAIRPEMTVRQVASDYPPCREILAEYGEPADRPGRFGHFEPLQRFAQHRGIELNKLLSELSKAAGVPIDRWGAPAERVHRGFIVAALAITLTLGAGWGAWLLWSIANDRDFTAAAAAHIVAHGEAQLWGFIGLFIAGVSLRTVLSDAVSGSQSAQVAGKWLLTLVLISLAGSFAWSIAPSELLLVGLASSAGLLVASLTLWGVQLRHLWSKRFATWARAVMISGLWLTVWAVATCVLRWRAGEAGPGVYSDPARLLLIELAVFGFAMNSIYGFGQMLLPGFLRTGKTRFAAIEAAFWLHNLGVAMVVASSTGLAPKSTAIAGAALIATGAVSYAIGQHIFIGKPRMSSRPEQGHWLLDWYIPLAFAWLVLSLLMLVSGELYPLVSQNDLPHAYMGAVRHALTVGFMTTLILGVGQRLLPVLEHSVLPYPWLVLPILILIAIGNALRVVSQLATIETPSVYPWMPLSAVLEWTALLLFTINVCTLLWRRDPLLRTGRVTAGSSLAVLLAEQPSMEDKLIERGSKYLLRARTVPYELTIGSFAESENMSAGETVRFINEELA